MRSRIEASIHYCMVMPGIWRLSIQSCMVELSQELMSDQLSAQDWLDQGLKTLAKNGFTALKAEPLAKAMGVSRGSFYWHFADIGAFHAAILTALARDRRRADHRQCRGRLGTRRSAGGAAAPGVRRTADARERGPHLGQRRSRGPRRGAGDRPAPARLCRRPVEAVRTVRRDRRPARKSSIGRFSALRYRTGRCQKTDNRRCSTKCCGSPRDDKPRLALDAVTSCGLVCYTAAITPGDCT